MISNSRKQWSINFGVYVRFQHKLTLTRPSGVRSDPRHICFAPFFLILIEKRFPTMSLSIYMSCLVRRILQGSADLCGKYNPNLSGVHFDPGKIYKIFMFLPHPFITYLCYSIHSLSNYLCDCRIHSLHSYASPSTH